MAEVSLPPLPLSRAAGGEGGGRALEALGRVSAGKGEGGGGGRVCPGDGPRLVRPCEGKGGGAAWGGGFWALATGPAGNGACRRGAAREPACRLTRGFPSQPLWRCVAAAPGRPERGWRGGAERAA